jgi:hypothetical protein
MIFYKTVQQAIGLKSLTEEALLILGIIVTAVQLIAGKRGVPSKKAITAS